jgi:hypothetical protein
MIQKVSCAIIAFDAEGRFECLTEIVPANPYLSSIDKRLGNGNLKFCLHATGDSREYTFTVTPSTVITVHGNKASLGSLQKGMTVNVAHQGLTATRLDVP